MQASPQSGLDLRMIKRPGQLVELGGRKTLSELDYAIWTWLSVCATDEFIIPLSNRLSPGSAAR